MDSLPEDILDTLKNISDAKFLRYPLLKSTEPAPGSISLDFYPVYFSRPSNVDIDDIISQLLTFGNHRATIERSKKPGDDRDRVTIAL